MDQFAHLLDEHAFPSILALALLWLAFKQHDTLQKRVTKLEAHNAHLVTSYAASFEATMKENNAVLSNLAGALADLQGALAMCPHRCPALAPDASAPTPENAPG